jgi:uncharacterized protein with von Willebrand factor type A (vWA) domain
MLLDFFNQLRRAELPVSTTEYLVLLEGLSKNVGVLDLTRFYQFARLCLVKDESLYDRFDQVFNDYWAGRESAFDLNMDAIPDDWLKMSDKDQLTDEQKAMVEAMGGWDKLMETLAERLKDQTEEHHGGSKWIGTRGTSPFGHGGFNPEGIRIGGPGGQGRAVKVWEQRRYKDLDGNREFGTRDFKVALRSLRRLTREGRADTLDLPGTIKATANSAGLLDLKMQPERRNSVNVLLLLDAGGSMDYHTELCEQLFSAARAEFKHLEHFYFHNFVYEKLWRHNHRRHNDTVSTLDLIRTYGKKYRLIFVGDATMSPYEVLSAGGSVEHWNQEAGAIWLQRMQQHFAHCVWLNPEKSTYWPTTPSIRIIKQLMADRMFTLNTDGIASAVDALKTPMTPVNLEQ